MLDHSISPLLKISPVRPTYDPEIGFSSFTDPIDRWLRLNNYPKYAPTLWQVDPWDERFDLPLDSFCGY